MYLVVNKEDNKILWLNKAPLRQGLKPIEVWYKFKEKLHRIVKCENLPLRPFKVDGEIVRTMTIQEQVDAGYIILEEDQIIENNKIRTMTDKEKVQAGLMTQKEYEDKLWEQIRNKRNSLLYQCDWTQLPDAPEYLDQEKWVEYRQNLRDVPQNNSNPESINWPIKPEIKGTEL